MKLPLFLAALLLTGCATQAPRDRLLARATVAGYITQEDSGGPPILHLPDGRTIIVQGPDASFEPHEEVVLEGEIRMTNVQDTQYFYVKKIVARHPSLRARR